MSPETPLSAASTDTRDRAARRFAERLPGEVEKATWPLERLWALRDERLRALVRSAQTRSPWHAERLRGVRADALSGNNLAMLPVMTKSDVMDHWDEIVADRRLTLAGVNTQLERIVREGPSLLLGEYLAMATGGSTGKRGVFVWHVNELIESTLAFRRGIQWRVKRDGARSAPPVRANVSAVSPIHMTTAIRWLTSRDAGTDGSFSPSQPMPEIVAGLNALQPELLYAYPSMLGILAAEARASRLRIRPHSIWTSAEPLLGEIRSAVEQWLGVPPLNIYATTECNVMAMANPPIAGLHVLEDSCILEPVDALGSPVPPGVEAAKLLVTNLLNQTFPLIRYEVSDQITFLDEPNPGPWWGRRIGDVPGRLEDVFTYANGVAVHPVVFASLLRGKSHIVEYQVRQTDSGAEVTLCTEGAFETTALARAIEVALERAGVSTPEVRVVRVDRIPRHPQTGKLRRFIAN